MMAIKATVREGRLEVNVPADWPDGIEVEIQPVEPPTNGDSAKLSPEEIASTLAAMDRMEPFDMSDEEHAAWETEMLAREQHDKAEFSEHAERLRRLWA